MLLGASGSCVFPLTIPVVFELVLFDGVVRCVVVPVAGSHSKCAGLTRSNETTLPFIRISKTLPLLTMTLYGPSEAVQLRFVAKIHVCMCQFPYTGKCFLVCVAR